MNEELANLRIENEKLKKQSQRILEYLHFFEKMLLCCQVVNEREVKAAREVMKKYHNGEWLYPDDVK